MTDKQTYPSVITDQSHEIDGNRNRDSECHKLTHVASRRDAVPPQAKGPVPFENDLASVSEVTELPDAEETTLSDYLRRWAYLKRRIADWRGINPSSLSQHDVADWLAARSNELRPSSWRQYKAAAIAGMIADGIVTEKEAKDIRRELSLTELGNASSRRTLPFRTSHRSRKRIFADELELLLERFHKGRGQYDNALASYLEAGRQTGLRPCEWAQVRFVTLNDGRFCLVVRNAKSTHGRSHGRFRRLLWSSEDNQEAIDAIAKWLAMVDSWLAGYGGQQRTVRWRTIRCALRDRFADVCRALWPRRATHPSLYSTRHLFAAAAKETYSKVEIAALMGHGVDDTATNHYARPPRGRRCLAPVGLPAPSHRDVYRVRAATAPGLINFTSSQNFRINR